MTRDSSDRVLIVGGGPAGLEAALTLARRGFDVSLADKQRQFGGRLVWETALPGLKQWNRVAEYRLGQLRQMANVTLYPESNMSAQDVLEFGAEHVVIATGARWLDVLCGANELPAGRAEGPRVYTPDDLKNGAVPEGPVAVFDFDNYYLGTAIAEYLSGKGLSVTYLTTAGAASAWTFMTNEQPLIHQSLARRGIAYRTLEVVTGFDGERLSLAQIFSGEPRELAARSLVMSGSGLVVAHYTMNLQQLTSGIPAFVRFVLRVMRMRRVLLPMQFIMATRRLGNWEQCKQICNCGAMRPLRRETSS